MLVEKKGRKRSEKRRAPKPQLTALSVVKGDGRNIPSRIKEALPMVFIREGALKVYGAKLNALRNVKAADDQVNATFEDGLNAARMLFDAYIRLGELVEENTADLVVAGRAGGKGVRSENTLFSTVGKLAAVLKVSRRRLEDAKTISRNPQYIPTVVEAKKRERLPSKSMLLSVIRAGSPGRTGKRRKAIGESKHVEMVSQTKKLAAVTIAKECTEDLEKANANMGAIILQWESIPIAERDALKAQLLEIETHLDALRGRYAPPECGEGIHSESNNEESHDNAKSA
jgi:hypothetical protein